MIPDDERDAMEMPDDDDEEVETEVVVHRLMDPPEELEDDAGILWMEITPEGEAESHFWMPDDADRARLDAFMQACQGVVWDGATVHEVPATEIRKRKVTIPAPAPPPPPREGPPPELTEHGLIRRVPHEPAPVAESWRRIEGWMSRHCPEVVVSLMPGASERDIAKFERAIGRPLPEDVRESYRIHDGLGYAPTEYRKLIRGDDEDADDPPFVRTVFYDFGLDTIRERREGEAILGQWMLWDTLCGSEEESEEDQTRDYQVFPADAIQVRYICRGWIPLCSQQSNHLGVDLAPGPAGVVGQVINFGRDEDAAKYVLATSWAQFLEDYADELENDNFVLQGDPGDDRYLYMKRPKEGSPLCHNWRAWAEAKLTPEFQAAGPPPPGLVTADPESERACRAVVDGFLAEYGAWEGRWLQARPLRELGFQEFCERADGRVWGRTLPRKHYEEQRLPVPEAVTFADGQAYDHWADPRWKALMNVGPLYRPAMDERRAIFARYTTAWAQRNQSDTFTLRVSPRFDVEAFRDAPVTLDGVDAAQVWSTKPGSSWHGEETWRRFFLRRERGEWRIERWLLSTGPRPPRPLTLA